MVVVNVIILLIILLLAGYCGKLKLQERAKNDPSMLLKEVRLQVSNNDVMHCIRDVAEHLVDDMENKQISFNYRCTPESMMGWVDIDAVEKGVILMLTEMCTITPEHGKITLEAFANHTYDAITIRLNDSSNVPLRLSLIIVRQLVNLHHGMMQSKYYKGQGNMAIAQIPIKKDNYLQEEILESAQEVQSVENDHSAFHIPTNIKLRIPAIELPEGASDGTQSLGSLVQQAYTSSDQRFLQRAIKCLNEHLDDSDYDRESFAADMGASASTLYNKLRALTGKNVTAFIRDYRIQTACKLAKENPELRVSDIAYQVGFKDPKYFATTFKKVMGVQPRDYLDRLRQGH